MNVLITTGEWKSALTCMRSLAQKGHKISLICSDQYEPHLYSKFCSEKIISPPERNKEEYIYFIKNLVSAKKYDLLIPISDRCMEYFSESREELGSRIKIHLPSKESLNIAKNKANTYHFCEEIGISIPKTYYPHSIAEVEKFCDSLEYPCVVKEVKGTGGSGNTYVHNKENLLSLFQSKNQDGEWPVVQEFIKGQFCGFTAVCNNGKMLDYFMFKVIRQYPRSGGITVYARSYYNEEAFKTSELLVKKLSWTGPIDLDFFMVDGKGFVLLEINPRFSGTIQFAYACGIDLPYAYLELAYGKKYIIENNRKYKTGIYYRNIFPEEIYSCKETKAYIPAFFFNFLRFNTYYDFSLADPNVIFWHIKLAKWNSARYLKKKIRNMMQLA